MVIENFLSPEELTSWRTALDEAVEKRNGNKMPDRKEVYGTLDDAIYDNGRLFFIPGSYRGTTFDNPGIGKNMGAIFTTYPQFHNGLTIHGAHANMTPGYRRAMTCAYMPPSRFSISRILSVANKVILHGNLCQRR